MMVAPGASQDARSPKVVMIARATPGDHDHFGSFPNVGKTGSIVIGMNRIKPSWIGSICLTILLFLLYACSITTGNQTTSLQVGKGAAVATATEDQIAQAVFQAINQSRAANGLAPLTWSTNLANSARQHDLTMQAANTLSHQLPGEADLGDRERHQGVN
jgi:hypothetical protein